jgi:hypothetical protein
VAQDPIRQDLVHIRDLDHVRLTEVDQIRESDTTNNVIMQKITIVQTIAVTIVAEVERERQRTVANILRQLAAV